MMFFLWVRCGNNGKSYYLPEVMNWSGHLHIGSDLTGSNCISLPVTALNGNFSIELPEGFEWVDGYNGNRLEHCQLVSIGNGMLRLDVHVAQCKKNDNAMRKYALPRFPITIGSKENNVLQYHEPSVSRNHGTLTYQGNGSWQYTDHSKFGTFINGRLVSNAGKALQFGDRITILPSLSILFLGNCIAVNHVERIITNLDLFTYVTPDKPKPNGNNSVWKEYHRAPRHIQQPNVETIEIDPPIEKEKKKELPTWLAVGPSLTMVMPMLMSSLLMQRSMGSSLIMIGTSSALAVMWSCFNRSYQKKQSEINERHRQIICRQYYAEMEERIQAETDRERKRLLYNYLSPSECTSLPTASSHRLWERLSTHNDFLHIRLGLGERSLPTTLNIKPDKISLTDDPLRHEARRLHDQYSIMNNVPIVLSLKENTIIGILGDKTMPWLMQSMVLQIAATHSYHDVRIAVIHGEDEEKQWGFTKWLPHVYASDDRTMRMSVCHASAIQEVLSHIDTVLSMRNDMKEANQGSSEETPLPWYIVFCTDPKYLEDQSVLRYLSSTDIGITFVVQSLTMERLPKECSAVIEAKGQLGAVYSSDGKMTGVQFEVVTEKQLDSFSHDIAPVRIKEITEDSAIPSLVTFLETYHARSVDHIDVRYFWNENHAWQSVKLRLGFKAGSLPFVLDISDKNHGPHGLIAGTTGAGKSVLLQSFILSLAINYSPTEIQFILIDYKGGGTSEDFRNLPHAAGIIDSLQGERRIFRALASIKGEILRREEIFKRVGVNNIDDYMKYYNNDEAEESLGHLIIIVDEFAELKKEQPEFMSELVSAARVGRSLGMHLVLATQKPSNSVSDEIAANTRFRICLRVASKSDSNEMLKRPDAAYLKGMGRCFVQVGNDELFEQVQTSYSGAEYAPGALRAEEEPRILNEAGQPIKLKRKKTDIHHSEENIPKKTELDAILEYLNETCDMYNFEKATPMWLEEISQTLLLEQIQPLTQYAFRNGAWPVNSSDELLAYFAIADDIEKQRHIPVAIDFITEKNLILCGLSGSGKTTALQSIAVSLAQRYTPEQVEVYVFSLTSRMLSCLEALPHVGEIVYDDELDEQVRLMDMIHQESERRKKLFAKMSTDNFVQYNKVVRTLNDGEHQTIPFMVVLIDRMQQLREWNDNKLEDKLQLFYDMLRSASSQGIYFVITAYDRSELPIKYQSFVHGISLQMNDRMDYAEAVGARIPIEWGGIQECPGRGMIARVDKEAKVTHIYEIQTAVYHTVESDSQRAEAIRSLGAEMKRAWKGGLPKGIERIPKEPKLSLMLKHEAAIAEMEQIDRLPWGYEKNTGKMLGLNLRELFSMLICGPKRSGKTNIIKNIATIFALKGAHVYVIGSEDLIQWGKQNNIQVYAYDQKEWEESFNNIFSNEVPKRSELLMQAKEKGGIVGRNSLLKTFQPIAILIDDFDQYMEKKGETSAYVTNLRHFYADKVSGYGIYTFVTMSHNGYQRMHLKQPVMAMAQGNRGLMLQGRLGDCLPFDINIPFSKKNEVYPLGEAMHISDQETMQVVIPQWDELN